MPRSLELDENTCGFKSSSPLRCKGICGEEFLDHGSGQIGLIALDCGDF